MSPCSVLMESDVKQLSQTSNALPLPGTEAYEKLPQFPKRNPLPFRRTIRRQELRLIVPLAETTIYEMERRGEFPRRFNLTPRCVVWDLNDVEAWIEQRKQASRSHFTRISTGPDVRQRKTRPVQGEPPNPWNPAPLLQIGCDTVPPQVPSLQCHFRSLWRHSSHSTLA